MNIFTDLVKFTVSLILGPALFFATLAQADQVKIDAIEHAFYSGNTAELKQLQKGETSYETQLAAYRASILYSQAKQELEAKSSVEKTISGLNTLIEADPTDVESTALLANVYGYAISIQPFMAESYGPRSHALIAKAIELEESNPRVQLFRGIIAFNTPVSYGGSKQTAQKALEASVEAYANDMQSEKHWGYSEALIWLGLTLKELGDAEGARKQWQQALVINPQSTWAAYLLES